MANAVPFSAGQHLPTSVTTDVELVPGVFNVGTIAVGTCALQIDAGRGWRRCNRGAFLNGVAADGTRGVVSSSRGEIETGKSLMRPSFGMIVDRDFFPGTGC